MAPTIDFSFTINFLITSSFFFKLLKNFKLFKISENGEMLQVPQGDVFRLFVNLQ